jgi:hypothetical protein
MMVNLKRGVDKRKEMEADEQQKTSTGGGGGGVANCEL